MLSQRFNRVAIGSTFIYGNVEYIKQTASEAIAVDGSCAISFEINEIKNLMVESNNSSLLKG